MKSQYSVFIDGQRGSEEYDGGSTIAEARLEASFFVKNTPTNIGVRIYKVRADASVTLVEVVR